MLKLINFCLINYGLKHGYVGEKGLFLSDFMMEVKKRVWIICLSENAFGFGFAFDGKSGGLEKG